MEYLVHIVITTTYVASRYTLTASQSINVRFQVCCITSPYRNNTSMYLSKFAVSLAHIETIHECPYLQIKQPSYSQKNYVQNVDGNTKVFVLLIKVSRNVGITCIVKLESNKTNAAEKQNIHLQKLYILFWKHWYFYFGLNFNVEKYRVFSNMQLYLLKDLSSILQLH